MSGYVTEGIALGTGEIIGQEWLVRGAGDETAIPFWRHAAQTGKIAQYEQMILDDVVSVMVAQLFRGPGSNCGIVDENFSLVELRPAGVLQLPLEYYASAKFDMGLYRIIGEADFGKLAEVVNASLFSRMKTSYGAVMATACKTQQLKYPEPETNPMDLVYAGNLRLIAHT